MRTAEQIVQRVKESDSFFGFEVEVLAPYLTLESLAEIDSIKVKDPSTYESKPLEKEAIIAEMSEYMEFAWGKVDNHRGLSASRSIEKMKAWLWLLGDEELYKFADAEENYPQYGAPILARICKKYGFPIPEDSSIQNMIQGMPCIHNCEEGCGY